MLSNLSNQLGTSALKRQLFFIAATLSTLLLVCYNFGTFDEAMHVPFLKSMTYPSMYAGDSMLSLQKVYYSYFWHAFVPFLKLGWLEPALFIVHVASIYLSFWAIWELSETLFHDHLASLIAVLGFIIPHLSFVGFPIFEFAPLSRTFVLPFLLIALNQFFKDRIPLAFLITGAMYNVHVVSVNFVLAMFGLACLLEFRRIGIRRILFSGGLFLLAALPVLLWKAGSDPIDFTLRPEWVAFLNKTLFFHIFAMIRFSYPGTWVVTLGGISALVLFFVIFPKTEVPQTASTARNFIYAGIIVVLVNVIAVYVLPVTILIQSQVARIGLWILIIAYLYFAGYLARLYRAKSLSPAGFLVLLIAFIFSPTPILVLFMWWLIQRLKKERVLKVIAAVTGLALLGSYLIVWLIGFWTPGIYIYGHYTPWVDVQRWARENTDKDARFITPPEKWGVQESDWRVHSERASAVTLSELLVAAFEPGYEVEWMPRFELLAPGALARFNGDYFWNVTVTRQAYQALSTEQLVNAACRFNAQYIVSEKPYLHPFPLVYENSEFAVYDLGKTACP